MSRTSFCRLSPTQSGLLLATCTSCRWSRRHRRGACSASSWQRPWRSNSGSGWRTRLPRRPCSQMRDSRRRGSTTHSPNRHSSFPRALPARCLLRGAARCACSAGVPAGADHVQQGLLPAQVTQPAAPGPTPPSQNAADRAVQARGLQFANVFIHLYLLMAYIF